jgi:cyclic beta-1,2-glucan synthetase
VHPDARPGILHDGTEPISAELYSLERLEQHAESLARLHTVVRKSGSTRSSRTLRLRLKDNDLALRQAYRAITQSIRDNRTITPAAEWLIDNSHVVEKQIRDIRVNLPPGFYRQLPRLADGPFKDTPRIFALAWGFIAHTDSRFDTRVLSQFIAAYQRVQLLTIGELWALAVTLRIVLVENLRRLADGIVLRSVARWEADALANQLLGVGAGEVAIATEDLWKSTEVPLPVPFAAQLVQRLRDQDPAATPAVLQLEERLRVYGTTADEVVREEHLRQGTTNITVRNVITSMRRISEIDWAELFEGMSLVDASLRAGSNFAAMDFATRNRYRGAIEELARRSSYSELQIAEEAVRQARHAGTTTASSDPQAERREEDPGFYLISGGRRVLERQLEYRPSLRDRLNLLGPRPRAAGYLLSIALLTALVLALMVMAAKPAVAGWILLALAPLVLFPASDAGVALVNRIVASLYRPERLPALDLRGGIPAKLRTMVVVPTLLTTEASIREQIERLEVHYLASPDGDLHFAVLSDWMDATSETVPGDDELLALASAGIAELNQRYGAEPNSPRFLLLHRRRVWNEGEGKWIGWERKRGKLLELNRLLRGQPTRPFCQSRAARQPHPKGCAMSSPSTPTRGCHGARRGG